ncbi:exopolyphosphatase [Persicobacter psychrovividus]|uniref:Ppx/GppA phosphatase N-terminal domain-containing protein n=1 Tax=Persicobacter psychrovividus TaxID=387638 RepID=A0ABN6LA47_9BACT|nr:hypothetical protein PEPS_23250 [Persicobacter psychrovividus]
MKKPKIAILDLGTNTFHLLVVEPYENRFEVIYREKIAVGLGRGGINEGYITPDAQKRALNALVRFRRIIRKLGVEHIKATGTSALRCAKNGQEFVAVVKDKVGIDIHIISGNEEAELIYFGVKKAVQLKANPSLIIDIGGGSVEFIIGNNKELLWKKSFEIGGQRLLDKFHEVDPIPNDQIVRLNNYLSDELKALASAIEQFHVEEIIGCSGAFDSFVEIFHESDETEHAKKGFRTERHLPVEEFLKINDLLVSKNRDERILIPGMIPLRADMIVVAALLVKHVIERFKITNIRVSSYALKEGLLTQILENTPTL